MVIQNQQIVFQRNKDTQQQQQQQQIRIDGGWLVDGQLDNAIQGH